VERWSLKFKEAEKKINYMYTIGTNPLADKAKYCILYHD
jgi:hypothetical protein